ncbi:MAG: hypothetical protein ACHQAY_19575 [Hyphomicrobiales bacterium]
MAAEGVGSGAAALGLPANWYQDQAAKWARAREMGFQTDMPLYHGTASDISAFDPAKLGSNTGTALAKLGVWSTRAPELAGVFAERAAARGSGSGQSILPLVHRADNPAQLTLKGSEHPLSVAETVRDAFDRGHDAVWIKNFSTRSGPTQLLVVKNPNQLRSRFAKFDPAERDSPDLLAGLGALGVGAAGLAAYQLTPVDHDPFASDQPVRAADVPVY